MRSTFGSVPTSVKVRRLADKAYGLADRVNKIGVAASYAADLLKLTQNSQANLAVALPYAGLVQGGLGLISSISRMVNDTEMQQIMESEGIGENFFKYAVKTNGKDWYDYSLFMASWSALSTGSNALIYYSMAMNAGIKAAIALYDLSNLQAKINNDEKRYGRASTFDLTKRKHILEIALINLVTFTGWMALYMGNPMVGAAFLAISSFYAARELQQSFAPNMFSFNLFRKKPNQRTLARTPDASHDDDDQHTLGGASPAAAAAAAASRQQTEGSRSAASTAYGPRQPTLSYAAAAAGARGAHQYDFGDDQDLDLSGDEKEQGTRNCPSPR